LGAALAATLTEAGAVVHGIIRAGTNLWRLGAVLPALTFHTVDLRDAERVRSAVEAIRPAVIYHLAADRPDATTERRREVLLSNVIGLFNLLEACRTVGYQRLIVAGSSLEYGPHPVPLTETLPLEPRLFYGATKAMAAILARQHAIEYGLPITLARIFSIYGPWEQPKRLIPTAILAALEAAELPLTAGAYRRDFIYSGDVVTALRQLAVADSAPGEVFNVASGQQTSNAEVVALIDRLMQARGAAPLRLRVGGYVAHASDTAHWVADTRKIAEVIGWRASTSLESGLEATIAHIMAHRALYQQQRG
jgi:nucleoside-diphosphate-sugar epimerase